MSLGVKNISRPYESGAREEQKHLTSWGWSLDWPGSRRVTEVNAHLRSHSSVKHRSSRREIQSPVF